MPTARPRSPKPSPDMARLLAVVLGLLVLIQAQAVTFWQAKGPAHHHRQVLDPHEHAHEHRHAHHHHHEGRSERHFHDHDDASVVESPDLSGDDSGFDLRLSHLADPAHALGTRLTFSIDDARSGVTHGSAWNASWRTVAPLDRPPR